MAFDLSVARGEHLLMDDVESLILEAAANFTGQRRSLGSRLSGKLAGMSGARQILKLLNFEIDRILQKLADKFQCLVDCANS